MRTISLYTDYGRICLLAGVAAMLALLTAGQAGAFECNNAQGVVRGGLCTQTEYYIQVAQGGACTAAKAEAQMRACQDADSDCQNALNKKFGVLSGDPSEIAKGARNCRNISAACSAKVCKVSG